MTLSKYKIAIVVSQFNSEITESLLKACVNRLKEKGILSDNISVYSVPGAVEIPFAAKMLAKKKTFNAIIALGAVIQGETDHYDYVCQQVSYGCQKVMIACETPVIFGVLTVKNIQQAYDRLGGKQGHKGIEAADSALSMLTDFLCSLDFSAS